MKAKGEISTIQVSLLKYSEMFFLSFGELSLPYDRMSLPYDLQGNNRWQAPDPIF